MSYIDWGYYSSHFPKLTEEEFDAFIRYHMSTCERMDLMGASGHTVDILTK